MQALWCKGVNVDGKPCRKPPQLIGPDGYCAAHREGGHETMMELARKGGEATARAWHADGLSPDDLPPLRTHEDAQAWLEAAGRAVATGKLTHAAANALTKAAAEWVKAEGERITRTVLDEMEAKIKQLEAELAEERRKNAGRAGLKAVR